MTQLCLLPPLACLPLRFNRCSFPGNTGGEAGVRVRPHLQGQPRLLGWQPAAFPDGSTSRSSKLWHRPQQLRVRGVRCRGGQARPGSEEELGSRWTTGRWTPDPPGSAVEGWGGELLQEGLSAQPSCPQSSQPGDSCLRAFFLAAGWACGIVVPQPGIEHVPPTLQARRLSCWTTGEVSLRDFSMEERTVDCSSGVREASWLCPEGPDPGSGIRDGPEERRSGECEFWKKLETVRLKGQAPSCPPRTFWNLVGGGAAVQAPLSPLPSPCTLQALRLSSQPAQVPLETLTHLLPTPPFPPFSWRPQLLQGALLTAPQGQFPTPLAPTPPASAAASGMGAGRRDEGTCCSSFCPCPGLKLLRD